ncbi:hypothetical protein FF125_07150 [Aureibaculum algae]|uniref:NAD glycohydrolase translocation F5/8 type C domain-containing protein n=1 Tax=Aureibaculum algae TaxID=2584122 RepID=A0A5B7TTB1_9FLAO|nr:hypothetical protein [Aureibaculum algae]QCX38217.1 hypothetical protein FF125_07150 [Aureibaculum algae]
MTHPIKSFLIILTITCFSSFTIAQNTNFTTEKIITPKLGKSHDISESGIKAYQKIQTKLNRIQNDYEKMGSEGISKSDAVYLELHEMDTPPNSTDTPGCSWYCAALINNVIASSTLDKSDTYKAWNIHDFDLSNTWATNKNKGIGERITFVFGRTKTLSIHQIQIYNGYQKSESTWENNSRAKKLALSINGKQYAYLELEDVRNVQIFTIDAQKFLADTNLTFDLKIMEIYPGKKYDDLCISEINFDGAGDH